MSIIKPLVTSSLSGVKTSSKIITTPFKASLKLDKVQFTGKEEILEDNLKALVEKHTYRVARIGPKRVDKEKLGIEVMAWIIKAMGKDELSPLESTLKELFMGTMIPNKHKTLGEYALNYVNTK